MERGATPEGAWPGEAAPGVGATRRSRAGAARWVPRVPTTPPPPSSIPPRQPAPSPPPPHRGERRAWVANCVHRPPSRSARRPRAPRRFGRSPEPLEARAPHAGPSPPRPPRPARDRRSAEPPPNHEPPAARSASPAPPPRARVAPPPPTPRARAIGRSLPRRGGRKRDAEGAHRPRYDADRRVATPLRLTAPRPGAPSGLVRAARGRHARPAGAQRRTTRRRRSRVRARR